MAVNDTLILIISSKFITVLIYYYMYSLVQYMRYYVQCRIYTHWYAY